MEAILFFVSLRREPRELAAVQLCVPVVPATAAELTLLACWTERVSEANSHKPFELLSDSTSTGKYIQSRDGVGENIAAANPPDGSAIYF